MRVLVSVESKHGSTEEIAAAITAELIAAGLEVDALDPPEVESLDGYQAVVLGSALYMGKRMPGIVQIIERHAQALRERDVWLFSSGPIREPPNLAEDPVGAALLARIGARKPRMFTEKLDRGNLSIVERLVSAPEGDFRDWPAIREWARSIAGELSRKAARSRPASLLERRPFAAGHRS